MDIVHFAELHSVEEKYLCAGAAVEGIRLLTDARRMDRPMFY